MNRPHPYKTYIGTLYGVDYWVYYNDHTSQRAYLEEMVSVAGRMLARMEPPMPANDVNEFFENWRHGYGNGD